VEMLGANRMLFATDGSIVVCTGKLLGADISEADKKTILEGTDFLKYFEKAGK